MASKGLIQILALDKVRDQLLMTSSVRWYDHVFSGEGGQVLRRALECKVEGQWKKGRLKRTWERQEEEESVKVVLSREDALWRTKWSVGVNIIATKLR